MWWLFIALLCSFDLLAQDEPAPFCASCALQKGEVACVGGVVAATQHFIVQQDYAVPIPGFMIISSVRHIQSLAEFTAGERADFIELLVKVRQAMRQALGIEVVYMIQEEDASHFHTWLFPRYQWMEGFGVKIKSVKPIMKWAQQNLSLDENVKKVEEAAHAIRDCMAVRAS